MVDPMTALTAASVVSDLYGGWRAGEENKKAARDAARAYGAISTPSIEDLQYDPSMESYVGDITAPDIYIPESIKSEMAGISTDPRFDSAQFAALGAMDDVIQGGGLTDMDRLNAERAMRDATADTSRAQADIQQDMARRGMGGSGQELLSKLAASQSNINRASDQQQALQAQARERALQAMMAKGQMAQSMQGQQFGQRADVARDKDAINKFNTQLGVSQRNLGAQMGFDAARTNQSMRQGLAGRNTASQNQAKQYNTDAYQTDFKNKMAKADSLTGANRDSAKAQGDIYRGGGRAISKGIESYIDSQKEDPKPTYNYNFYPNID